MFKINFLDHKSDNEAKHGKIFSFSFCFFSITFTSGLSLIFYLAFNLSITNNNRTTTLLATAGAPQNLSTLISNQTGAALNGGHSSQHQSAGVPSYYELTYATGPLSSGSIEQPSYIYATGPGQAFSYAQLPTGASQQQAGPNSLSDVYGNHTAKYMIDDHGGTVDRDHHQRATAGW